VVRGPPWALVAVRWNVGGYEVPELIALCGNPPEQSSDFATVELVLSKLLHGHPSPTAPLERLIDCLIDILRERLASVDRGGASQVSKRLSRCVLRLAYDVGKRREHEMLVTLDGVLNRLRQGVRVGGERRLTELLARNPSRGQLNRWLSEQPQDTSNHPTFEVSAALFGDGSTVNR